MKQIAMHLRLRLHPAYADKKDYGLIAASVLLLACLGAPHMLMPKRVYDWFIVLDITQSMNVRDYDAQQHSRLQLAKQAIRQSLRSLPCGSRVALGLFTERETLNIVKPLEVCSHFSALDQTVERMDWRMAWAADSFIRHGVFSAVEQTPKLDADMRLLFITDGNQAPPANPKYMPSFAGTPGKVRGYLIGAGQTALSPIPKLDENDNITGYWDADEVMRFGTFGMAETLSVLAMEGYHGRNSPHGSNPLAASNAHLSGLDEAALQKLSSITGLQYLHMEQAGSLRSVMQKSGLGVWRKADTDLRPWLAMAALALLLAFYLPTSYLLPLAHSFKRKKPV